jgi:hypothetical protein
MRRWTKIVIEIAVYAGVVTLGIAVFLSPKADPDADPDADSLAVTRTSQAPASSAVGAGKRHGAESEAGDSSVEAGDSPLEAGAAGTHGDASPVEPVSLFPAEQEEPQEVRTAPRRAAAAITPAPKAAEPAPWLSYVGMVSREGTQYHYFKNERTNRVIEAALRRTADGYRLRRRVDGTFVLSSEGRSYVVGGEEGER